MFKARRRLLLLFRGCMVGMILVVCFLISIIPSCTALSSSQIRPTFVRHSRTSRFVRSVPCCAALIEEEVTQTSVDETLDDGGGAPTNKERSSDSEVVAATAAPQISLLNIASSITQDQCPLLGVKSIGVDYGLVRTGVAVTVGYDPTPLAILTELNNTQVCEQVLEYAKSLQADKIVVGLPLHKNGTVAEQTNLTLVFAEELARATLARLGPDILVELWDERYTSKEAAARAHAKDPHRFLYGSLDAEAACIILEHYYNDNGQGRIVVPVVDDRAREACLQQFHLEQDRETERRLNASLERSNLLRRRKEAIALARAETESSSVNMNNSNKKNKRKRKRRR